MKVKVGGPKKEVAGGLPDFSSRTHAVGLTSRSSCPRGHATVAYELEQ